MWVDSKTAAAVLGVNLRTLQRKVVDAQKKCQKILTIDTQKIMYQFIFSNRGGTSGKVLQIWLDDEIASFPNDMQNNKGCNNESNFDTRACGILDAKGLQGSSICETRQGEYQSSEAWQNDTGKESASFTKRDESSINDENNITKCNKTGNQTQEKSMDKSCQSRINGDINDTQDKENMGEIRRGVLFDSQRLNADMGVEYMAGDNRSASENADENDIRYAKCSNISNSAMDNNERCGMDELDELDNSKTKWVCGLANNESEATKDKNNELEELFNATNIAEDKKADAYMKAKICKIWLKNKDKKIAKIDAFLSYINSNKMYDKKVSKGLMYDWLRRYENGGIKALVDSRGGNKPLSVELLGYKEKIDELIMASQGKITAYNVYNRFHHTCVQMGLLTHDEFIAKEKYILSYDNINRYVNKWRKENPTTALYIEKGYDGAINSKLGAVGKASWKAKTVNEYVEIDATTLDIFAKKINLDLASEIWKMNKDAFRDFEECKARVEENQKRYTVVGMIDVYSGVCSYVIGKSENIYTVKRCLAKYIAKFGKPITVVGDNGKAFKSHEMQGTFDSLDIEYQAVRAYSGWLKPYIERSWRSFQDNFSQNLAGFIGHSVVQRQAIEFGFSKMERRLKKGEQTNLKRMQLINDLEKLMDDYIDEFMNPRWLDRLGKSPLEAYKMCEDKVLKLSGVVVCARLGKMLTKKVYKKGIMHDNAYYVCAKSFAFDAVKIVPNINNVDEVYIWSGLGEFIGVGTRLNDGDGISPEIAKEARSFSKNKIDKARKAVNKATIINQDSFVEHMQYAKSLRACEDGSAALEYEDELTTKIKIEHKKAKSLKVMSVNLIQSKPKKEINISWEGLVKGK